MLINEKNIPLAALARPKNINDFMGQSILLQENKILQNIFKNKTTSSMILTGEAGVGKTTLANIISQEINATIHKLSAVSASTKEIKDIAKNANKDPKQHILFLDEIHRFSKSQQDILLNYIEEGVFILIGATSENPSYNINKALLSRTLIVKLKALQPNDILEILKRANKEYLNNEIKDTILKEIADNSNGDARKSLNILEILFHHREEPTIQITHEIIKEQNNGFNKLGDDFYTQLSAFHKSIRGSSPDGALYWMIRMLEDGVDGLIIARRMLSIAGEDIGNADPRALPLANSAYDAFQKQGAPEGYIALAHCATYLASAPKSNASYLAFKKAKELIQNSAQKPKVPLHLIHKPSNITKKDPEYKKYRYSHDEEHNYSAGQSYLPKEIENEIFYLPKESGLEIKIKEKLIYLKELDKKYRLQL